MPKQNASKNGTANTNWADREFALAPLPDRRLVKRVNSIATAFAQHPTAPIPQACGSWGEAKGAYRFFDNDAVEPEAILSGHVQATIQRCQLHPVVLCAQDTTTLNYSTHPDTQGLGPIGNNRSKTIGLFLHSTLALSPAGQPLGILHARTWARRTFGRSSAERNRMPRSEKESQKWMESFAACQQAAIHCPNTRLINVADREGDLYDLFAAALAPRNQARVEVLVRAQHNRQVAHPQKYLWDYLGSQPVSAQLQIQVPRKDGHPGRVATLAIRFARVTLRPPCLKENQAPLSLWAVEARELHPPKGAKAICWRLLTTLPVESAQAAVEKVRWYAQRWQIEIIHKVLKSGCQIEQRQLETVARLQRVLAVDLIVAWRVLALCKASRETPEGLASDWLQTEEWRALWCYIQKQHRPPSTPPNLRQTVRWIAQLGGFLGRRSDGEPGPIVLWRGLQQLRAITAAWKCFGHQE
jgi:hypothetical protein